MAKTVLELLATGKQWTQGCLARDIFDVPCMPEQIWATQWCLTGAIGLVYGSSSTKESRVIKKLENLIFEKNTHFCSISEFNDDPSTTFRHVKALVREAGI